MGLSVRSFLDSDWMVWMCWKTLSQETIHFPRNIFFNLKKNIWTTLYGSMNIFYTTSVDPTLSQWTSLDPRPWLDSTWSKRINEPIAYLSLKHYMKRWTNFVIWQIIFIFWAYLFKSLVLFYIWTLYEKWTINNNKKIVLSFFSYILLSKFAFFHCFLAYNYNTN